MKQIIVLIIAIFIAQITVAQVDTISFEVDGVCVMCQSRIEKTAFETKGVQFAFWDVESHLLQVKVDKSKFREDQLHKNLAKAGHRTEQMEADTEAYKALPNCCKYDDPNNVHKQEKDHQDSDLEDAISGMVYEKNTKGKQIPLVGATIQWVGDEGGTVTDEEGHFLLDRVASTEKIIVGYVGYQADTIDMAGESMVAIILTNNVSLDGVEVVYRRKSTEISFLNPLKTQMIGEKELLKAACCNLSESFETNPSVDVSFTDAVTGTRQIEMLGLAGPYVQTMRESMPDIRGLSSLFGFTYTPGTWVEGIQLNMGAGSVANGFESITGQINVELRKPENSDKLYLNLYASEMGRLEANANFSQQINENWSTAVLLHGKYQQVENDRNEDGFLDMPLNNTFIGLNRWKYSSTNGLQAQFGVKAALIDQVSGQEGFDVDHSSTDQGLWGTRLQTERIEGWAKIGKVFPSRPYASMGFQLSAAYHNQDAYFGMRPYNAEQLMLYANLIYQGIFSTTDHKFKTGLSFQYDDIQEEVGVNTSEIVDLQKFERMESVPGAFFEYTYTYLDQFTAVVGLRGDYHNNYGFFATPRLHLRYAPTQNTAFRASLGRGLRTANIFAENIGLFASNRRIILNANNQGNPYDLNAEVAWNYGINFTQNFNFNSRSATLSLDAYHTNFDNQIVVDYETTQQVSFYNLAGESFSNSLQAQIDVELINRWDVRLAYRFNDVQTDYDEGRLQKPFVAEHRAFINTGYETQDQWKFDFTLNWQSSKRIPSTKGNPIEFQLDNESPDFFLANAQISKGWGDTFEIYLGGENLFNFRQDNPIINSQNPFDDTFDSSLIWGPIFGRNIYVGARWRL